MDFYTLKTTVDINKGTPEYDRMIAIIGFFTQPLIIGDVIAAKSKYTFRFAVALNSLSGKEEELLSYFDDDDYSFNVKNTEIIKAARL